MDELILNIIHTHGQLIEEHLSQLGHFLNNLDIYKICNDYVAASRFFIKELQRTANDLNTLAIN